MTVSVYSTAPDGTGGIYLDSLGQTGGWAHTLTSPGGDASATFTFAADPQLAHAALTAGRIIRARAGAALVFTGQLDQPDRSQQPWGMSVVGQAAFGKSRIITAADGATLNAVVDAAIANGLLWTRPASLTAPTSTITRGSSVDDALGLLATDNVPWALSRAGVLFTPTAATVPTLVLWVTDLPSRTLDGYANVIVVTYMAGGTTTLTTVVGSAAELAKRGRIEALLDLTGNTSITTSGQAQAAGQAELAAVMQPTWQAPFVAAAGSLSTIAGAPIDPATVRPGQIMRVFALHPDDLGTTAADILIGQIDYDDTTATLQLTPAAAAPVDFTTVLAKALR